jgi:hypothetical protein
LDYSNLPVHTGLSKDKIIKITVRAVGKVALNKELRILILATEKDAGIVSIALQSGGLPYIISCKNDDYERRYYYAVVIQKLEGELGLKKYNFPEIKDLAADFLDSHQVDPSIHDMSVEEIEELMRKSDADFWLSVH